jgi:hypothetical protein
MVYGDVIAAAANAVFDGDYERARVFGRWMQDWALQIPWGLDRVFWRNSARSREQ